MTLERQAFGKTGEDLAVAELERRGYAILARRYRTKHGEIDIVARDGETMVFVEVKARATAEFGTAAEAVTRRKQRRLASMAVDYLARNQIDERALPLRRRRDRRRRGNGGHHRVSERVRCLTPVAGGRRACGTLRASHGRSGAAASTTASGNNSVVECDLAKVEVAGSNPVSRSNLESAGSPAPRLAAFTPPALRRRLRSGRSIAR